MSGLRKKNFSRPKIHTFPRRTKRPDAQKRTKYFTSGNNISEEGLKTLNSIISKAYQVPEELVSLKQMKDYLRDEKRKTRSDVDHHTYNSRLNLTWKLERLYVADDVELPGKSVTEDIDPEFFKIISGRPIKNRQNMLEYIKDIRACFLTRLKTGFHLDEILLMDERHAKEAQLIGKVRNNFFKYSKGFEDFLKEDHLTSIQLLEMAKQETKKSKQKLEIINRLKNELKKVETEILETEEQWRKFRMFQKFLYLTAPQDWRKAHDPDYGKSSSEETVSDPCLFDRFREFPEKSNADLDSKISKFLEDIKDCQAPVLYFTDPQAIENILVDFEKNNLRCLIHCKELDFPAARAMTEVEKVKTRFEKDQAKIEEEIKFQSELVKEEEDKSEKSEKKLRDITFGLFRNLITDEEYLSVTAFLEDAYEDIVAPTDTYPDLLTMIKEIELKYESILLDLDKLPTDLVIKTKKRFYKEERRDIAEAKEAERKVHQMNTLLKRLGRSLQAPKKGRKERRMVSRSQPPKELLSKSKICKTLTQEEINRKLFFERITETSGLHRPLCV